MWVRLGACHWSRRTSPQPFAPRGKGRFARVRGARQSADWLRPRPFRAPAPSASVRRQGGELRRTWHGRVRAFRRLAARRLHLPCRPAVMRILCVIILQRWFSPSGLALAAKDKISPRHGCTNALRLQLRGAEERPGGPRAPMTGTSARNGRTRPIPVEVRPVSGNEGRGRSESAWTPKRQGVKAICRLPNPRDARRNMRLRKSLDRRKPDAPLRHTRHTCHLPPRAPPAIARTSPTAADRLR